MFCLRSHSRQDANCWCWDSRQNHRGILELGLCSHLGLKFAQTLKPFAHTHLVSQVKTWRPRDMEWLTQVMWHWA